MSCLPLTYRKWLCCDCLAPVWALSTISIFVSLSLFLYLVWYHDDVWTIVLFVLPSLEIKLYGINVTVYDPSICLSPNQVGSSEYSRFNYPWFILRASPACYDGHDTRVNSPKT